MDPGFRLMSEEQLRIGLITVLVLLFFAGVGSAQSALSLEGGNLDLGEESILTDTETIWNGTQNTFPTLTSTSLQNGELKFDLPNRNKDVLLTGSKEKSVTVEDYQNPSPNNPDWNASIVGGSGSSPDADSDLQEVNGNLELTVPDNETLYRYTRKHDALPYEYGTVELSAEVPSNYFTRVEIVDDQGTSIDNILLNAEGDSFNLQSGGNSDGTSFQIDGTVNLTITADSNQVSVNVKQSNSNYDETLTVDRKSDTGNNMFLSFVSGFQTGSVQTQKFSPVTFAQTNVLSKVGTSQINYNFSKVPEVNIVDNKGTSLNDLGGFEGFNQLEFGPAIDLNDQGGSNYQAEINKNNLPATYEFNNENELSFTGLNNDVNVQGVAEFARARYIDWTDEDRNDYTITEVDKQVSFGDSLAMEGPGLGTVQRNDGQNPRPDEEWRLVFTAQGEEASPADIAVGLDNVTGDFSQGDADVSVVYDVTKEQLEVDTNIDSKTVSFPKSEVLGGQEVEILYQAGSTGADVIIENLDTGNEAGVAVDFDSNQFSSPDDIGIRSQGIFGTNFQDITELDKSDQVRSTIDDNRLTEDYTRNPGNTTPQSPGFGTWNTINSSRPGHVAIETQVETDGTNPAKVSVLVDENGDNTQEYNLTVAEIPADNSAGTSKEGALSQVYIPAGGQYQISNVSDPNNANTIEVVREAVY